MVICFLFRATRSLLCWRAKENHLWLMISSSAVPFKSALINAFRAALHCFFLSRKCYKALFGLGSLLDWEIPLASFFPKRSNFQKTPPLSSPEKCALERNPRIHIDRFSILKLLVCWNFCYTQSSKKTFC